MIMQDQGGDASPVLHYEQDKIRLLCLKTLTRKKKAHSRFRGKFDIKHTAACSMESTFLRYSDDVCNYNNTASLEFVLVACYDDIVDLQNHTAQLSC